MLFAYLSRITSNFLFFLIIFPDFTEPASLLLRYPHLLTVETGKHYFHTPTSDFHPSATRSPSKCSKAPPLPAPSPPPAPGVRSLHQSTDNPVATPRPTDRVPASAPGSSYPPTGHWRPVHRCNRCRCFSRSTRYNAHPAKPRPYPSLSFRSAGSHNDTQSRQILIPCANGQCPPRQNLAQPS